MYIHIWEEPAWVRGYTYPTTDSTRKMLHHRWVSLSEQHTADFIFCCGIQAIHVIMLCIPPIGGV